MKILFNVKYSSTWDNENSPLQLFEGNIDRPLYVKWNYEDTDYEIIGNEDDFISNVFLFQEFIIVCYSKKSKVHAFPNNVVVYNFRKEIIKIVLPPKPINWNKISPIYSIGEIKEINGENYLATYIDTDNDFSKEKGVIGFIEIRWLNLKTFEYHPTEHSFIKDYGR